MFRSLLKDRVGVRHAAIAHGLAQDTTRASVLTLLAGLSFMGGLVHLGAAIDHAEEPRIYVVAFVLIAAGQVAGAATMLWRPSDRLLLCIGLFNAAIVMLWALSRTVGLPFTPVGWVPESVGVADLIATAAELIVIVVAWSVVLSPRRPVARYIRARATGPILAMLLVTSLYGVGAHAG